MLPPWDRIAQLPMMPPSSSDSWSFQLLLGPLRTTFLAKFPCYAILALVAIAVIATLGLSHHVSEDAALIRQLRYDEARLEDRNQALKQAASEDAAVIHQLRHYEGRLEDRNQALKQATSEDAAFIYQLRQYDAGLEDKNRALERNVSEDSALLRQMRRDKAGLERQNKTLTDMIHHLQRRALVGQSAREREQNQKLDNSTKGKRLLGLRT
ncbi:unnamed protein product [Polarella glacialis]|uniref:Uncharacterized protein n=1 Tax=Polarella glacialis TaxID=89957 RepID=A0A813IRJ4_POLGL|nr:unnamed protein product [Polarella glacialis]